MAKILGPQDWGLAVGPGNELVIGQYSAVSLARKYGTPLHVLNQERLRETATRFRKSVEDSYPGKTSVHYAFKCNSVPTVVQTIKQAGLKAEVMSEFELDLALCLGYRGEEIIVNGPCKTTAFLENCLDKEARFIIVDSLEELKDLARITETTGKEASILLRVNPDYVPRGMNQGAATGSRKGCAFGLDLKAGEIRVALNLIKKTRRVNFCGYHFHIGTGIRDPKDYSRALQCLPDLLRQTWSIGFTVKILDVGGGFASVTTRELTTYELLLYQGLNRLPGGVGCRPGPSFARFAEEISNSILRHFPIGELPELLYEPGRCLVSPNQLLLLTIHRVKDRPGLRKWLISDGGLGTVTLPTFYEYHEVFLCNDLSRPRTEKVTIVGPVCFAGDAVYRNKLMPVVHPGEVLAIMDSGAYFTALESSFGFPRPAIVAVSKNHHGLVRKRETFEDMISRDHINQEARTKEEVRWNSLL